MFDLTGKTALVTGATGGIGGAVASALHARGATVALSGTRREKLEALAAALGARAHVLPCDLSDATAVDALAEQAAGAMGGLDILVSNAGLTRDGLMVRMKDEDWQTVIDVNLTAYFRLSRAAAKIMMKKRKGRIVGIASVVGVTGNPGQANYVASKAGMIGMSKSLAAEVASGGTARNRERNRGGGRVSRERRGELRHGPDDPRQRRHGDDLIDRGRGADHRPFESSRRFARLMRCAMIGTR